ncbi:MAG: MFS transporter [Chloroflexota bacterium]|nr:MFS transporter [Chloroflexota bacterium]
MFANPFSRVIRPRRADDPVPVYLLLAGGSEFLYTLVFTVNMIYQATVVGLSPLQLVLVGTTLEAVAFLGEVPTGIVADVYSRRRSIIIGLALIGAGFTLEGSVPSFAAVLASQVLWGLGYTFTSGATEAWITDEVGEERVGPVFLRGTQAALAGTIAGIILSAGLGLIAIQLPIILGGVTFVALAVTLALIMPERNFHRTPPSERSTWRQMGDTFLAGARLARRREVVRTLLAVSLVIGLASEAFDRLSTLHILETFTFPLLFGTDSPVLWFGLFSLVGSLLGLGASEVMTRLHPESLHRGTPARLLAAIGVVQVTSTLVFALAGSLWLAVVATWVRGVAWTIAGPLSAAWMNRNLETRTRATVLSMQGQMNAIGQVTGGPALGWVGNRWSVQTALVGSGLVLSPIIALYARASDRRERPVATEDVQEVTPSGA